MRHVATLALGLCAVASFTACASPCERLRDRALSCDTARGSYAGDDSVCEASRAELGVVPFDAYADCVLAADCDDAGAVERCQTAHLGSPLDSCTDLTSFAAACGLEPVGTDDGCATLRGGLETVADTSSLDPLFAQLPEDVAQRLREQLGQVEGAPRLDIFAEWVTCVTTDGCPAYDDDRYATCDTTLVPPQATDVLEACLLYTAWTERCDGQGGFVPIEATSFPECLAQAQPFVPATYLEYAQCLDPVACDDLTGRISCFEALRVTDREGLAAQCTSLVDFAAVCEAPIGGGSVEACERILAPFTRSSTDLYVDCVINGDCETALGGAIDCSTLLELQ